MPSYQLHIQGLVQGVGFRPFVHKIAKKYQISGWVSNGSDGVRIEVFKDDEKAIKSFFEEIIYFPPKNAIITSHLITEVPSVYYPDFSIKESNDTPEPDLMLTPDICMCEECKKELYNPENQRFGYPFTTCLNCGPRYSIQTQIPYDRSNTTMSKLEMCSFCDQEYQAIGNRRYYSQTNSCPQCAINLHFFESKEKEIFLSQNEILFKVTEELKKGKIIALKGTGGYLLLCDATKKKVLAELRKRKNRPKKPFALLFKDIKSAKKEVRIRKIEEITLKSEAAPIVLCKKLKNKSELATDEIAPGLDKLGIMIPNTPLLQLVADNFGKPLVATSANLSGSPIVYTDKDALQYLWEFADVIITYDREIINPQDDSVVQFTESEKKIILRRSRGLAPNFFPVPFQVPPQSVLAVGADIKGAFGVNTGKNLFISQFLGDQSSYESQVCFNSTLNHITKLMRFVPEVIISDLHPDYFTSRIAEEISQKINAPSIKVQHHEAHFLSVVAENKLIDTQKKILGVVWDGLGLGTDGKIWGGEFFEYKNFKIARLAHFNYYPYLASDKMSREPRLSALSLLKDSENKATLKEYFNENEWKFFNNSLQHENLMTSSMGRFLDGISCILGLSSINSFEAEAAMKLESLACAHPEKTTLSYSLTFENGVLKFEHMLKEIFLDKKKLVPVSEIAVKVFNSLVKSVEMIAQKFNFESIAFSGGVMQNAFLIDKINEILGEKYELFFHKQLSPNDENIALGQIAHFSIMNK